MSVSKFESLPNEILVDILEKYLNGIDIIKAFAFQLNRRFDALVTQCQRLCFDFIRCHKDDFRFCIGLLPAYMDKIEELILSEQNTPGQIHAFLSFYPSFSTFTRLRRLYFHVNMEIVQPVLVENALGSLSNTSLDTLSVNIIKTQAPYGLDNIIVEIFSMKTLKKLIIACDNSGMNWKLLNKVSSNIEYLTIKNISCQSQDLKYIFRCASGLKYLDIDLSFDRLFKNYQSKSSPERPLPRMSMLHTAIFNIYRNDQTTHSRLEPYFRCMPSLHRLEIKTYGRLSDFSVWETLLQTLLPSVAYFTFEMTTIHLSDDHMSSILRSIQTPFWIEKQNFHVIIKCSSRLGSYRFSVAERYDLNTYKSNEPVTQWWIAPQRNLNDNLSALNKISRLYLCNESLFFVQNHYYDNVTHLAVAELNDHFFEVIIKHVNCSQIKYLDVSSMKEENNKISSLLPYTRNITSLRINLDQLSDHQFAYLKECSGIKCLDISASQHRFDRNNISVIGNMFPNLEHLTIDTENLRDVPKLQTYLPRLRSLTFRAIMPVELIFSDGNEENGCAEKLFNHTLRESAQFLFQHEANYITVWIDQAALQDSFWRKDNIATDVSSERSMNKLWLTTKIGKLSSLFK